MPTHSWWEGPWRCGAYSHLSIKLAPGLACYALSWILPHLGTVRSILDVDRMHWANDPLRRVDMCPLEEGCSYGGG